MKFTFTLTESAAEKLEFWLRTQGHDYKYAQAGCELCKLHQELAERGDRRKRGAK